MKVPRMAGDPRSPQCPRSYRARGPGNATHCRSSRSPSPGEPSAGRRAIPGRFHCHRAPRKERRDPILGDAFLQARLAPCGAAAIFKSLVWQPVAVSVPFPPRSNLKDEFNIYLLARELREAARGSAANSARNQHAHPAPRCDAANE